MDRETYLRQQLAALHRSYLKEAQPIIDQLVQIESCKPMPPIFITEAQAKAIGLLIHPCESTGETKP